MHEQNAYDAYINAANMARFAGGRIHMGPRRTRQQWQHEEKAALRAWRVARHYKFKKVRS